MAIYAFKLQPIKYMTTLNVYQANRALPGSLHNSSIIIVVNELTLHTAELAIITAGTHHRWHLSLLALITAGTHHCNAPIEHKFMNDGPIPKIEPIINFVILYCN